MLFHCNTCRRTYPDDYPIDDTCAKCGKGLVKRVEPARGPKDRPPAAPERSGEQLRLDC